MSQNKKDFTSHEMPLKHYRYNGWFFEWNGRSPKTSTWSGIWAYDLGINSPTHNYNMINIFIIRMNYLNIGYISCSWYLFRLKILKHRTGDHRVVGVYGIRRRLRFRRLEDLFIPAPSSNVQSPKSQYGELLKDYIKLYNIATGFLTWDSGTISAIWCNLTALVYTWLDSSVGAP